MSLFQRKISVQVDDLLIDGLEIEFQVERFLRAEPNTLNVSIHNLSGATRKQLQSKKKTALVELVAGYTNQTSRLFLGNLRKVEVTREGADIITTIEAGDGERAQGVTFSKHYKKNTKLSVVLKDLVTAMGVGVGNIEKAEQLSEEKGINSVFVNGTTVSGYAVDSLTKILKSRGISWSVQDNIIQILGYGTGLSQSFIELSPSTGLIETPSLDNKGVLTAKSLIIPGVVPGRKIKVVSDAVNGTFTVHKASYSGSYYGSDYYIDIEGKA